MENNTPMTHQEQNNDEIDLLALAGTLWDGRWLIIGVTILATLLGAIYALLAEPVYRADAMVQVEQKSGGLPGMSEISEMFGSESAAVTEIELIKSRAVMGETVEKRVGCHIVGLTLVPDEGAHGTEEHEEV